MALEERPNGLWCFGSLLPLAFLLSEEIRQSVVGGYGSPLWITILLLSLFLGGLVLVVKGVRQVRADTSLTFWALFYLFLGTFYFVSFVTTMS